MPNTEEYTGIARGLDQAVRNFYTIKNARSAERDRVVKADTDNKIQKLKIKQLEDELDPDNLELAQEALKAKIANDKTLSKMNTIKLKKAERESRKEIEDTKNTLLMRNMYLRKMARGEKVDVPAGQTIKFGDITLKGATPKSATADESLDYINKLRDSGVSDENIVRRGNVAGKKVAELKNGSVVYLDTGKKVPDELLR